MSLSRPDEREIKFVVIVDALEDRYHIEHYIDEKHNDEPFVHGFYEDFTDAKAELVIHLARLTNSYREKIAKLNKISKLIKEIRLGHLK